MADGKADHIGYAVCHQISVRSYFFGDHQLPLCARCSGQYLGALLSKSFYLLYTGKNNPEAYDKVIEVVQSAKEYARKEFPYYDYMDWFDTNLGHAYLLRHGPGDQTTAINTYKEFIDKSHYGQDNWELLQKDFRDLHRAGIVWPDLKEVVLQIKPSNIELSEQDWKDMGVEDASRTEK